MNTKWGQNGNGSIMYPGSDGPVDSIRLEALRDGVEDYEYLYTLKQLVGRASANPSLQPLIERAQRLLAIDPALIESMRSYAKDPQVLLAQRQAIAELIVELQRTLAGH